MNAYVSRTFCCVIHIVLRNFMGNTPTSDFPTCDRFRKMAVEKKHAAELGAFDFYYYNMKMYLNPAIMQGRFISAGLVDGGIIGGGGAMYQQDHEKMATALAEVRRSIALNGRKSFVLLVQVLNSVSTYKILASQLHGKRRHEYQTKNDVYHPIFAV